MTAQANPRFAEEPPFEAPPDDDPAYRQLPANLEIEMALLGAILVDNRIHEQVGDFLEPEHFFDPSHRRIFDAVRLVVERGGQASPATLRDHFRAGIPGDWSEADLKAAGLLHQLLIDNAPPAFREQAGVFDESLFAAPAVDGG